MKIDELQIIIFNYYYKNADINYYINSDLFIDQFDKSIRHLL